MGASPAASAATGSGGEARVLLVEDDPLTREVLAAALAGEGFDVHAEADGNQVERAARRFRPHLALVDVRLEPGADGLDVARRLRRFGDPALVFLTSAGSVEERLAGFDAGADDYIVKPFVVAELVARMRAVLRRVVSTEPRVFEVADLVVDQDAHTVTRGDASIDLTPLEFALLTTFCEHPGIVLSKVRLLSAVWGFEFYDLNVVEVHLSALRRKLEEHGERLIHTVRGVGYVLRP